ncbi:Proline-rich receptor-like protein kinase PERK1 [Camellia lanceoleosa]|uniref:Proline-rich receptor-like protein kinase PERK1 n=1 Tax=Camellia lanceoleosa TaxID=1840588 RepID=A0ACC0HRR6_9ERIC|nr:Proline-rich receptor-like protein kinase PERK1 [Camellia lanceoleosa]
MTQTRLAGEDRVVEVSGGRTVVVGVKLDSHSRELLTWALVKVAQPGDCVIALHVLNNNEIVDRDGKSSLLSLIKAFDSVLAVYEGFCNLKQVDLKLKVCRGSSIRKVLVREAKFYLANEVIVGTSQNHHTICSSASVAKYCAKNLPKDCSILAVDNGKVVFQRKASPPMANGRAKGIDDQGRHHLLSAIQSSASKNSKLLHGANVDENPTATTDQITCESLESALVRARWDCAERALKKKCSICSPNSVSLESSCFESTESSARDSDEDNSKAIVPVKKIEAPLSPISSLIRELPEVKPGWPLLHRAIFSDRQVSDRSSVKRISAVQWALQLPSRHCLHSADSNQTTCNENKEQSSEFDEESGSIVSVGAETVSSPSSPSSSSRSLPEELKGLHEKYSESCRLFKYQELLQATSNFIPENLIGKGGSSRVYRGCLPDGKELAVKILKQPEDLLKEFVLEIEIITALHHKNIISLFGFCFEDCNLLMVYDFLSRGSLEENLHGNKKDSRAFGWSERFKVAVGVAEALEYLHNVSAKPVIHRDVKSSNILLSDDFEPQLSDFGLAKWASTSSSQITCTDVAGTFGYLAPEYFMFGKVNEKIDVYAFGVVLLELLSGRKPISNDHPKGQESLVVWAKSILKGGKVSQLLDPSMGNKYDHNQMERMVLAATLCIRRAPRARPQMSIVLKLLQGDSEVIKWARLQVHASEGTDMLDGEALPRLNLQSHLNVALLDVEEDSLSLSSIEQSASLKDYLQGRWSRSASFD